MADIRQHFELLFFDTFSHENTEELNLDLVQFPRPVVIGEVRVIPLQTRVQADVPGGVRLGATNPSNFKLELFVNNLSKPNASTFEMLGTMDYKANEDIQLVTDKKIPTDGLILKGWYNTLTISIYGLLTSVNVEPEALPPPPPPQPRKQAVPVTPQHPQPTASPAAPRDIRTDMPESWDPAVAMATPHTTQHPLDYINQQLQQANIQSATHTVSAGHQPLSVSVVPQPIPTTGQMPMGISPHSQVKQEYHPEEYGRHPPDKDRFSPGAPNRDVKMESKEHYDPREQYEDSRSRDNWGHHDNRDRLAAREHMIEGRDFPPSSREGSSERRDRDSRDRDYNRDRDPGRDYRDREERDRDRKGRSDYDRGSKERTYDDRGRQYDDREQKYDIKREKENEPDRDRGFERDQRDRDIEQERGREFDRDTRDYDRNRDKEFERGREGYRDSREGYREPERGREREAEREGDRGRDWEAERGRERDMERDKNRDTESWDRSREPRDIRDRGFRDRTREDYREKERTREVYMETEAPRSPSRSRSYSPDDRVSSRSPSVSPTRKDSWSQSPSRPRSRRADSPPMDIQPIETIPPSLIPEEEPMPGELEGLDPLSPDIVGSPMEPGYGSDGDYEAISSEDEFIEIEGDMGLEFDLEDDAYSYATAAFNPYQFELTPLLTFKDIDLTLFEQEKATLLAKSTGALEMPWESQKLLDITDRFKTEPHGAEWVQAMESVPALLPKGLTYLLYRAGKKAVLDSLLDWMNEGLDEAAAMAQPESVFKVRHLKMGFKLASALCTCDTDIAIMALQQDVQKKLLDNFESQYMSFSLKLQIIAALDQTTRLHAGILWFLGIHPEQAKLEEPKPAHKLSSYQRAVTCLLKKQVVRVVIAMSALVKKIHIYEVMNKLAEQLDRIAETSLDVSAVESKGEEELGEDPENMSTQLSEADIDGIIVCLEEITKMFTLAPTLMAQPGRTLPGKTMFDPKPPSNDPYPGLYHLAVNCRLFESLLFLVASPATSCVPLLFGAVRSLVQKLYLSQQGLVCLARRADITNKIVQALIQVTDYNRDEVTEDNIPQQLGLDLIYHLQTISHIDKLKDYHTRSDKNLYEDQDPVNILLSLYTMTFSPLGRAAVVQVFSQEDNILTLLPFVKLTGVDREDARLKKSVCAGYTTELLNIIVHHSESIEFLQNHGETLLKLGESEFNSKLARLKEWLSPLPALTSYKADGLPAMVSQLRTYADDISKLPRGLITILRILKHLSVPPPNEYPDEKSDELKYKFVLIELFSAECFPLFLNFLQKLSELLQRPWQKGLPWSTDHLSLYLTIIRPCLAIIKSTTQYLIMARGTEFRDLTALPVLFELHTVLCSVPSSTLLLGELTAIQKDIIDTVAAYTQPLTQYTEEDGEKISKSLWTLAMRDLLKFTMKAPYTYLSGLQILSELLPLPLPLQTREPLSRSEEAVVINTRKLWSAHLLPLHGALHNIIRTLSVTSCQLLQQILRKICWQMSDLAAPTATMITECVMDILLEHMDVVRSGAQVHNPEEQKVVLATRGRFLSLLAYLLSQPAIKCTMLRLIEPKSEDKYSEVLSKMLLILNEVSERPDHVQDQECIVSILQSLCDVEVTLTSGETTLSFQEQVSNALPSGDQLTLIILALMEHIAHPNHKYDTVLPCIRALVMLTEHDYSFYLLKRAFEKQKIAIYRLLNRIKFKFSKDSSDCLSTFSTTLEFLRLLMSADPTVVGMPITRTLTLNNQELREVVGWTQNLTNHPLVDLQKLLEDGVKEEETLDSLLESVSSLIAILKIDSPTKHKQELVKPELPAPVALVNLFNIRATYTVTDADDERLSVQFWQTTFEPDEPDVVPMDLELLCQKYCNNFNLEEELKKDIGLTSDVELTKPKKQNNRRKSQEFVTWRARGMRRPFVAPMRGRGIARGLAAQANRHDPFRSRPPNTSRPPSMHVDDFMKLEQKSNNQRPESSDNQVQMRREGDFIRGRGRGGFDRGRGGFDRGRGRFLTPPTTFRREVNTQGGREGDNSMYGTRTKSPFVSPRSFSGPGHERGMSGDRREGRGGRFEPQRGRGSWRGGWTGPRFKDERFSGGGGFRGGRNDINRHQRSFTK